MDPSALPEAKAALARNKTPRGSENADEGHRIDQEEDHHLGFSVGAREHGGWGGVITEHGCFRHWINWCHFRTGSLPWLGSFPLVQRRVTPSPMPLTASFVSYFGIQARDKCPGFCVLLLFDIFLG
jgi:hypothetical protein